MIAGCGRRRAWRATSSARRAARPSVGRGSEAGVRYHFTFVLARVSSRAQSSMQFIINNWPLVLVMIVSGAMLLWPFVQPPLLADARHRHAAGDAAHQPPERRAARFARGERIRRRARSRRRCTFRCRSSPAAGRNWRSSRARPLIAYCARRQPQRGRAASAPLASSGFTEIYSLHGGLRAVGRRRHAGGKDAPDAGRSRCTATAHVPLLRPGRAPAAGEGRQRHRQGARRSRIRAARRR